MKFDDESSTVVSLVANRDLSLHGSPRRRQRVAILHRDEQLRLEEKNGDGSQQRERGISDSALASNWMRRTGWETTFAGADRNLLAALCERPVDNGHRLRLGRYGQRELYSSADDERQLVLIGQAVDQFFNRCEDTVRHTDVSTRCWLRSQTHDRPYKSPFELPGRESTRLQYRSFWKRLLWVYLRLYRIDDALRNEFLKVRLSNKQRAAIKQL